MLLGLVPTSTLIVAVGGLLVVDRPRLDGGPPRRRRAQAGVLALAAVAMGGLALAGPSPCDTESAYYCISVVADRDDMDGRTLVLDRLTHAYVDVADPTVVRFGYVQRFADAAGPYLDALDRPIDVLHLGGGGFTFPRYLEATRPGARQVVLELDPRVLQVAREQLGFTPNDALSVRVGDARRSIEALPTDAFDLVVGDAFGGLAVPWHLTTTEFLDEVQRVLRPGGMYVMNLIDYPPLGFVRAEAATASRLLRPRGRHRAARDVGRSGTAATSSSSRAPSRWTWPRSRPGSGPGDRHRRPGSSPILPRSPAFIGDAPILTDDFAPVDQLLGR